MHGHVSAMARAVVFLSLSLSAVTLAGEPPRFRRMLFEQKIKLQSEAPGVAASGHWAAFADQSRLVLVDTRTGAVVLKRDLSLPGEGEGNEAEVLGFSKDRVIVSISHDPNRPDPASSEGRLSFGGPQGHLEIVAVQLPEGDAKLSEDTVQVKRLFELPHGARVAPGLLEGNLVYLLDRSLHLRPLDGSKERAFGLGDRPVFRPKIRGRSLVGECYGSAYFYRFGAPDLVRVSCGGTALELLGMRDTQLDLCGDVLLVSSREELMGCGLDGKELWRLRIPVWPIGGSDRDDVFCVRSYNMLLGIDPRDGRVRWRTYCKYGYQRVPVFVTEGRVVVFSLERLCVFDAQTGACQLCVPQSLQFVRQVSYGHTLHMRAAVTGNTLVFGFETSVCGIDLTPGAAVPEGMRDIAYYKRETDEWHGSNETDLSVWQQRERPGFFVPLIAAHRDPQLRESLLEQVVADAKAHLHFRDLAACYLRLDKPDWLPAPERKLLFCTEQTEMTSEFARRLGQADAEKRTAALVLLGRAPDNVVVALEGKLKALPDARQRAQAEELVRQARARLALMATGPKALAP